jgi:hypothetical protein
MALRRCMDDQGWKIEVQPDGAFRTKVAPDQQKTYLSDLDTCVKQFEQDHPPPTLRTADYRALYKQELATMRCLEKIGYPSALAPVSEQRYVDDYSSGKAPSWYAYMAVANISGDAFAKVQKQCPQPQVDE